MFKVPLAPEHLRSEEPTLTECDGKPHGLPSHTQHLCKPIHYRDGEYNKTLFSGSKAQGPGPFLYHATKAQEP